MTGSGTLSAEKKVLRRAVRSRRAERTLEQKQQAETALAAAALGLEQVRTAGCVAVYASLPDEPGTGELRRGLRALGVRVLLPVVLEGTEVPTLDWALDTPELQPTGVLKLPEPTGERLGPDAIAQADVLLIPAMAVDTTGLRLGRGRGYYDAALARRERRALVLALVYDDELLDARSSPVPAEPHDRRVDGVLTPVRKLVLSSSV
jgi:5-formyltetrahydrofolate cyclo-ligase